MIVGSRNGLWPGSRSQSQTDSQWRTRMLDWLQTSRCVQGRRTHLWDSLKPMQITRNLRLAALAAPMSHKQSSRDAHRPFPHTTIIAFAILLSAFAVVASPKLCPLCTKVPQSRAPFVLSLGIARLSRLPKTVTRLSAGLAARSRTIPGLSVAHLFANMTHLCSTPRLDESVRAQRRCVRRPMPES